MTEKPDFSGRLLAFSTVLFFFFFYCSQDVGPTVAEFWTSLLHGQGQVFPIGQLLNLLILCLQICLLDTEWEHLFSVGSYYIKCFLHLMFFFFLWTRTLLCWNKWTSIVLNMQHLLSMSPQNKDKKPTADLTL